MLFEFLVDVNLFQVKCEECFVCLQIDSTRMGHPLPKKRGFNKLLYIVVAVLMFGLLLTFLNVYELRRIHLDHMGLHSPIVEGSPERYATGGPIAWVYGRHIDSGYLSHVFNVFERIGYQRGTDSSDWDVLWAHDYPFSKLKDKLLNLKPHQRVSKLVY